MCGAFRDPGATRSSARRRSALRSSTTPSPIAGCPRSASFRGYADHIEREEFGRGLEELLELSGRLRTAIMCAEAPWWRCHRALIADVLCARGIDVVHILDARHCVPHPYTSAAKIVDGRLSYGA